MKSEIEETAMIFEEIPDEERSARQLPKPCGYQVLVALPEVEEKFSSGIVKADKTREIEEVSSVIGFVMDMGADAYKDEKKFPNGPWCKQGDFILMGAFRGTRFKIHGKEFRLLADDEVLAVTEDPRGYTRA
jgi:co-chaperonin GroES (HSP10)